MTSQMNSLRKGCNVKHVNLVEVFFIVIINGCIASLGSVKHIAGTVSEIWPTAYGTLEIIMPTAHKFMHCLVFPLNLKSEMCIPHFKSFCYSFSDVAVGRKRGFLSNSWLRTSLKEAAINCLRWYFLWKYTRCCNCCPKASYQNSWAAAPSTNLLTLTPATSVMISYHTHFYIKQDYFNATKHGCIPYSLAQVAVAELMQLRHEVLTYCFKWLTCLAAWKKWCDLICRHPPTFPITKHYFLLVSGVSVTLSFNP